MNVKAATRPRSFLLVIVAVGFFFHLTYLFTIVDIYFRTPIVHGMQPVAQREDLAPAKRLVLFVGTSSLSPSPQFFFQWVAMFLRHVQITFPVYLS
jgi:hypothetical protein